ncbi:MAG: nitronate monooxygenase [Methylococcales bacterium]
MCVGIATPAEYQQAQKIGYAGVQMGTRSIASTECQVSTAYKQAIVEPDEHDIVHSERVNGNIHIFIWLLFCSNSA